MNLVIVESPTKARTLSKFLGKEFRVEATMGHVRDLPKNKIGVTVNGGVKMEYQTMAAKAAGVKELVKLSREADKIFLATDPDREGEAIAYHVVQLLFEKDRAKKTEVKRIVFHQITEGAVKEALSDPRELDMQLVDAQQARRALDRLVGYSLSPLLWRKVRRGLSAGRVQSVAVRLVVEREREIEKFTAEEYWALRVLVGQFPGPKTGSSPHEFWVSILEKNGVKFKISNGEEAGIIVADLEKAEFSVLSVVKRELKRTPPPPFTTSTLQQTAANKFGWPAKRTMQIAQNLYEEGFITYHRTDSTNLASEAMVEAKTVISHAFGNEYALPEPRIYKTKSKVAQEAHEAIRPARVEQATLTDQRLSGEAGKLYDLIWKRFVACQMKDAVIDQTVVGVVARGGHEYRLEARGERVNFAGWLAVYDEDRKVKIKEGEEPSDETNLDEQTLPDVEEGEKLRKIDIQSLQKFTQPPARYNEASLIKTLEELGIGRPSTYAPTISTILERRYVERENRRLKATSLGMAVNGFLVENFPNIVDFQFTAKMEDNLDEVALGNLAWESLIKEFYVPFSSRLLTVGETAVRVVVETEKTGEKCPTCAAGEVVIRLGKFGKFLSCSEFPECKYKANYQQKIDVKCSKDDGDIVVKRTRNGKSFYGCSNWPKCDFASWTKPKKE